MQLSIHQLMPIPLRDRLQGRNSGIWLQSVHWSQGELVFVQAPSGTGKTTLVHYLYGIRHDYEGEVKWDNIVVRDAEQQAQLRTQRVSVIFQDLRLFPELTAHENLEVKRSLTNTISIEEMEQWMDQLGILHKKNALASTLSYGEQQRVAIIRALLQPFKWLLMDEPFSHLDRANTAKAAALILSVVQRNHASLLLADLDDNSHFPYTQKILL
jgi:putative ABC transport system ATP-binding protein